MEPPGACRRAAFSGAKVPDCGSKGERFRTSSEPFEMASVSLATSEYAAGRGLIRSGQLPLADPLFPSLAVGPGRPAPGLKPPRQEISPAPTRIPRAQNSRPGRCSTSLRPFGFRPGAGRPFGPASTGTRVPGRRARKRKGDPHGKRTRIRHGNQRPASKAPSQ
jgi:hypothetical protein